MSTFVLKIIAIVTMLIDHIGAVFLEDGFVYGTLILYIIFRGIGRLAFPIFAFLIVEGFFHTKNLKKYLLRLGAFAFVSEIPFDLAFSRTVFDFSKQNIFFTLFLGLLLISIIDRINKMYHKKVFLSNLINGLITIAFCLLAALIRADYYVMGVGMLTIVAFYLFRDSKVLIGLSLFIIFAYLLGDISSLAFLATFLIIFYNGKKGRDAKYIFYIFYPVHLLLLYVISLVL